MDFYKVVKYVLMVVLLAILAIGVMNSDDKQSVNQPVVQQPQTKFNF